VALSLGSLPAGVTRRLVTVEPGLSSTLLRRPRPPDHLVRALFAGAKLKGQQTTTIQPCLRSSPEDDLADHFRTKEIDQHVRSC